MSNSPETDTFSYKMGWFYNNPFTIKIIYFGIAGKIQFCNYAILGLGKGDIQL